MKTDNGAAVPKTQVATRQYKGRHKVVFKAVPVDRTESGAHSREELDKSAATLLAHVVERMIKDGTIFVDADGTARVGKDSAPGLAQ